MAGGPKIESYGVCWEKKRKHQAMSPSINVLYLPARQRVDRGVPSVSEYTKTHLFILGRVVAALTAEENAYFDSSEAEITTPRLKVQPNTIWTTIADATSRQEFKCCLFPSLRTREI